MREATQPMRIIGLHMLGDSKQGLTERSKDVIMAGLEIHRANRHFKDIFCVSGSVLKNPQITQAEQAEAMFIRAGVPKENILTTTELPSTTSFEMQYFEKRLKLGDIKEFVGITSSTHAPGIKVLLPRHLCQKAERVVVFAFEDVLTTLPNDSEVRERYDAKFEKRESESDEKKWRRYETLKAFVMRVPGAETLLNKIASIYSPQITKD